MQTETQPEASVEESSIQMTKTETANIPLDQLIVPEEKLRAVDESSPKFADFLTGVSTLGYIINAISVCPHPTLKDKYLVIEGGHRFAASKALGFPTIPATIHDRPLSIDEQEQIQIIGNMKKVETQPFEYAKLLARHLERHPEVSELSLCKTLACTPEWLRQRLKLDKLPEEIGKLIDTDQITLRAARLLLDLPEADQKSLIDLAVAGSYDDLKAKTEEMKAEYRKEARQGKSNDTFKAKPKNRGYEAVLAEADSGSAAGVYYPESEECQEAFIQGALWSIEMDSKTLEAKETAWTEAKLAKAEEAKAAADERLKNKAAKAALENARTELQLEIQADGGDINDDPRLDEFDKKHQINKYKPEAEEATA